MVPSTLLCTFINGTTKRTATPYDSDPGSSDVDSIRRRWTGGETSRSKRDLQDLVC